MGKIETELETEAKRVLQHLLGGEVEERDTGGAQGLRDFDLVDTQGAVKHAVEVTSVQLPSARATRNGFERLRKTALGLTASWSIYVHEEAPIRPIERNAPSLLNLLHASGVTDFDHMEPPVDRALAAAVNALASLRIPKGSVMQRALPPRLYPGGFGSGSLDPANLTIAVETAAGKDDNRSKLAAAPQGAIRHLFVWLHDSNWYVSSLRRRPMETPPPPLLPPEVDVVWAAVGDGPSAVNCIALLRSDGFGWLAIDPISGTAMAPDAPTPAVGPPHAPPTCVVCNGTGRWEQATVERTNVETGEQTVARTWQAVCADSPDHWVMPGRDLSAAELSCDNGGQR